MNPEFNHVLYRYYNIDLRNISDENLLLHYNEVGQYQMRIYFPLSFFKKEIIYIYTTKFGYYISNSLKYLLFKKFIIANIIYKINHNNPNLHIILFSQTVRKFPKNYIIYQLEQKDISRWIDKKYELSILYSKKTWDYSESNIEKFSDMLKQKIVYFPIPLIPINYLNNNLKLNNNPSNDILFFGSMNIVRKKKLSFLQSKLFPKYHIKIVNKFGIDLYHEILNSKIVLNIHFYENAILETCRLNEILSCKKIVISEKPDMIDINNYELYKDKVIFVDNVNEMYEKILYVLNNNTILNICDNKNEINNIELFL